MRIAVAGGGPGGLYFSILMRKIRPDCEITLYERNAPTDAFGFGVVFSDETLTVFEHADPETYSQIAEQFTRWTDIDIHYRGLMTKSGGHGFSALGRRELLRILQERAIALGADVRFRSEAPPLSELGWADVIVGADGASSAVRGALAREFVPSLDRRQCRYIWLGADVAFGAFKFFIAETEHGLVQAHAYPYDERMSTFIVEMHERTWKQLGLGERSVDDGVEWCSETFADVLDGHRLYSNTSRWINFVTVRNRRWCVDNVVLVGDAAHTAHFSIGSGTKLAMEDAVSLAWAFRSFGDDVAAATSSYEAERRPIVESTQRAAQASLEWFEGIGRYVEQPRLQFAFNLLTRSRRVTYENLQMRDPGFISAVHPDPRPPMFTPLRLRGLELANRVVVSPMDMYSADDGTPGDFHLVHLGARALGGAGLVMTEMICVSAEGRITPGCAGMYRSEHVAAWERIVSFAHSHGGSAMGAQIGHSGRKGSTRLMWEGMDEPLASANWPLLAPSAVAYGPRNQVPREMTRADMDMVRDQFVSATRGALQAGFDLLELHMAHGYLLSSFLSPVSNLRDDSFGGSLENRARFPLEVLDACRAVWPADRPLSVRISATDWVPGGFDADDAVELARMLVAHGCDLVDVSSGQVTPLEKPAFGRSYQTPFADRIRHEVGTPVVAVGAISSYDDVNTIIAAGRADLCALARPHLYDPAWTLHAAADQEFDMNAWVPQYQAGSRKPPAGRDRVRSELERTFDEVTLISSDARP
ncbi:MAG TPA: bifunctional salicylyl-CoA 5-hydroxylase/oxidoreductase [Solirubrobacteraceae bacterium]|nr:bifunctional salicylyl-CoA 5-hydroxylase/oxidoreductase [Solirubrobacteraceae bacterium]